MQDLYGIKVSPAMVSMVTDKIMPLIVKWQTRPLNWGYPIVFLNAIHFEVRKQNQVVSKAAYSVLGVNGPDTKRFWRFGLDKRECKFLVGSLYFPASLRRLVRSFHRLISSYVSFTKSVIP